MKKIIVNIAFFIFLFFYNPMFAGAQIPNPCPDSILNDCPIDSNIYLLFVAAIFLAARKAYYIKNETAKKKLV